VIDLFNPDVRALPDYRGDVMLDKTFPLPDGRTVQKFVANRPMLPTAHQRGVYVRYR
jgi:hypothetical protein